MTTPAVTVLMPVYNAERFVAQTVDTILAQTFKDFEFLIINDGSASAAAIRELIERCRTAVKDQFGVTLRNEIIYMGDFGN